MAKTRDGIGPVLSEIERSAQRSPLFWWMYDHHDELQQAAAEAGRINWAGLCARFGELGLTDANGKPPTRATARMTWFRVRREVAKRRAIRAAAAAAVPKKPPIRASAWAHPMQLSPPARRTAASPGTPSPPPPAAEETGDVADGEVDEVLRAVKRQLNEDDRWMGGHRRKE